MKGSLAINTLQSGNHCRLISLISLSRNPNTAFRVSEEESSSVPGTSVGEISIGQEAVSDTRIQIPFRQSPLHRIEIPLHYLIFASLLGGLD